jgi:hypothetical protein
LANLHRYSARRIQKNVIESVVKMAEAELSARRRFSADQPMVEVERERREITQF